MKREIKQKTSIDHCEHSWCGHIVRYNTDPTTKAIQSALKAKDKALVVPVLVAVSENFQGRIIGTAIENAKAKDRIIYKPDAILPDPNVRQWIIDISNSTATKLTNRK